MFRNPLPMSGGALQPVWLPGWAVVVTFWCPLQTWLRNQSGCHMAAAKAGELLIQNAYGSISVKSTHQCHVIKEDTIFPLLSLPHLESSRGSDIFRCCPQITDCT